MDDKLTPEIFAEAIIKMSTVYDDVAKKENIQNCGSSFINGYFTALMQISDAISEYCDIAEVCNLIEVMKSGFGIVNGGKITTKKVEIWR